MYQNWRTGVNLWKNSQAGATTTQFLAKLIMVLPLNSRMGAMSYMEKTESSHQTRDFNAHFQDARRQIWPRRRKKVVGMSKGMRWVRENAKCELQGFSFAIHPHVDSNTVSWDGNGRRNDLSPTDPRTSDTRLAVTDYTGIIARSSKSSLSHRLAGATMRMFETHCYQSDPSEIWHARNCNGAHGESGDSEGREKDAEVANPSGRAYIMKPKKGTNPPNAPGTYEADRREALSNFMDMPRRRPPTTLGGKMHPMRIRVAARRLFSRPWVPELEPRFVDRTQKPKAALFTTPKTEGGLARQHMESLRQTEIQKEEKRHLPR